MTEVILKEETSGPAEIKSKSIIMGALLPFLGVSFLYCISYGLILFNGGLFHDDVMFYLLPADIFQEWASQIRAGWIIYGELMFKLYSGEAGVYIGRAIIFIANYVAGIFVFLLLSRYCKFTVFESVGLVGLFLLMPVFHGRIAIIMVPYSLSTLWFYMAWWCLYLYSEKRLIIYRVASLLLFYLSFHTESLLVFYLLPLILLWLSSPSKKTGLRDNVALLLHNLDFIILPLMFWSLRTAFFSPTGIYAQYNDPFSQNIFISLLKTLTGFWSSLWLPIRQSLVDFLDNPVKVLMILSVPLICFKKASIGSSNLKGNVYFIAGLAAFYVALLPFFVVGKEEFTGFGSRFQSLVPLGASLIIFFAIRGFLRWSGGSDFLFYIALCFILAAFAVCNLEANLEYQRKYILRKALTVALNEDKEIGEYHTYLMRDNGYYYNTRPYKIFDVVCLFREIFHDNNRIGMFLDKDDSYKKEVRRLVRLYNASQGEKNMFGYKNWNYDKNEAIAELILSPTPAFPNQRDAIYLTAKCLRFDEECKDELLNIVKVQKKIIKLKSITEPKK